jgi:predicted nucleic acid-binding protein
MEPVFIDTNVLVYANARHAPLHQEAKDVLERLWNDGVELWISRQVLREYLAVLSRPQLFAKPISPQTLAQHVVYFQTRFKIAEDGPGVTERLLDLMIQVKAGGKQVHDANIVATMQAHGLTHLLTHNTADFTRYGRWITLVPLTADGEE